MPYFRPGTPLDQSAFHSVGRGRSPVLIFLQSKGVALVGKVKNMSSCANRKKCVAAFFPGTIKAFVFGVHLYSASSTLLHLASLNTPRSVLIVDDSPAIRSVVVGVLRQNGYTAYEAESGLAALAEMQHRKAEIGLVLADVVMPDMDGLTLAQQLRKQMPKLPIILLSMHINEDTHWVTEESNFSFLPKPFESKQLLEAVRSFLG
jgi:CheY-like chemotaxis protein